MKPNLNTSGRVIRFAAAIILLLYAWWQASWLALAFGLFCLYEAVASWCIIYQLLGINSCKIERK